MEMVIIFEDKKFLLTREQYDEGMSVTKDYFQLPNKELLPLDKIQIDIV